MSTTQFIEATSTDPYVREIYRRVMGVLNDPSLDRAQREIRIRKLQATLREHQTKLAEKQKQAALKKSKNPAAAKNPGSLPIAHPAQIAARAKEMRKSPHN